MSDYDGLDGVKIVPDNIVIAEFFSLGTGSPESHHPWISVSWYSHYGNHLRVVINSIVFYSNIDPIHYLICRTYWSIIHHVWVLGCYHIERYLNILRTEVCEGSVASWRGMHIYTGSSINDYITWRSSGNCFRYPITAHSSLHLLLIKRYHEGTYAHKLTPISCGNRYDC